MKLNPLLKKLRLKPGTKAAVLYAPAGYLESLGALPEGVDLENQLAGTYDWLQVFVRDQRALSEAAADVVSALKPISLLWVCFPKGSSKMQTDLTRDIGWEPLQPFDLKWINLVSIDANWSAFSMRPFKEGEARTSFR